MSLNEMAARRSAEAAMPGPRRGGLAAPPGAGEGVRVVVVAPRHCGSVRVSAGRAVSAGTSPEYQRLVGLSAAALRAYAAARGWKLVGMPGGAEGRA